jgi:hypothetical protein
MLSPSLAISNQLLAVSYQQSAFCLDARSHDSTNVHVKSSFQASALAPGNWRLTAES